VSSSATGSPGPCPSYFRRTTPNLRAIALPCRTWASARETFRRSGNEVNVHDILVKGATSEDTYWERLAGRRLEAHIRFSTAGRLCEENCHPFRGEDISGRNWTLIHNGILFNEGLLASYDLKEVGETDSERTMLFLLDVLDETALRSGRLDFDTTFSALASAIGQISNLNRLNLILDDGTYTYVHTNTSEDTLHYRQLADDAIVISTQPLGDESERELWRPVPRNRLIAYRDGRIVRTSKPHGYVFCEALLELRKIYPTITSPAEKVIEHV